MAPARMQYSFQEVISHRDRDDCWVTINGKVYDVSNFVERHPGGEDQILISTGNDSTLAFDEAGHSDDAREVLKKFYIGELDVSTLPNGVAGLAIETEVSQSKNAAFMNKILIPIVFLLLAVVAAASRWYVGKDLADRDA